VHSDLYLGFNQYKGGKEQKITTTLAGEQYYA